MALSHNNIDIVRDSLITALDPGSTRSLPKNKTNILYLDETIASSYSQTHGTVSYDSLNSAILWDQDTYDSWGAYIMNRSIIDYSLDISKQYTASFEWKSEGGLTANFAFEIADGPDIYNVTGIGILVNSTLQSNGWYKFKHTFTPANSGRAAYFRMLHGQKTGTRSKFWWRKLQLEQSSSSSDWVSGVIGNTIYDLSGNSLNGTIYSPIYDSLNSGSLYLDGYNSYVDTGRKYWRSLDNVTLSIWAKTRDNTIIQHYLYEGSGGDGFGIEIEMSMTIGNPSGYATVFVPAAGLNYAQSNNFAITNNTWFNTTLTLSHSQSTNTTQMNVYFNGTLNLTQSFTPDRNFTGGNLLLGRSEGYTAQPARSTRGSLGAFHAYSKVLSAAEVLQNYNALKGRYGL